MRKSQSGPELSPELLSDIAKANPKRLDHWAEELERNGHVVLRTSFLKPFGLAAISWIFVVGLVAMFTVTPLAIWNPLSDEFGGWMKLFYGLVLFVGLILWAFGAVMWTFIFPLVRPRLIVSMWGIRTVGSKPGGRITLFKAAWSDIACIGGIRRATRWPLPPLVRVTITAGGESVERKTLLRSRGNPETVTGTVSGHLRGQPRDVLAFLVQVRAKVGEERGRGL